MMRVQNYLQKVGAQTTEHRVSLTCIAIELVLNPDDENEEVKEYF